jgi:hypothetical protein
MTTKPSQITIGLRHALWASRLARLVVAAMLAWLLIVLPGAAPAAQAAAPAGVAALVSTPALPAVPLAEDPLGTLGTKIENLARSVTKFATPLAILAIVAALLMYLFAPFLPDIAHQNKGFIMRALVIIAVIGFVPELVKAVGAIGAGG